MIVPRAIEDNLPLVTAFMEDVHGYTDCILSILSREINLGRDLKDCHRKDHPSSANMAMLKYLAWGSDDEKTGNMAHTDMGTLTVVFSKTPGLQALLPGTDDWSSIPPREGHAVVNVGDSLRFLSGGVFAPCRAASRLGWQRQVFGDLFPPTGVRCRVHHSFRTADQQCGMAQPEICSVPRGQSGRQGTWSHVDWPSRVSWGDWKLSFSGLN
jgi:hypothetical protein